MNREKLRKGGMALCVAGLVISLLSYMPSIRSGMVFPWPVLVGSAVYLPGAFGVFMGTKGADRTKALTTLRFIRLGFAFILISVLIQVWPVTP
jgi:hypothetical protein